MKLDLTSLKIDQIRMLNNISINIQKDFNNLTAKLADNLPGSLAWQLHPLISRHPYLCDLFNNICMLELVLKMIDGQKKITHVIVQNNSQYKTIQKLIGQKNLNIDLCKGYGHSFLSSIKRCLSALSPLMITVRLILSRTGSNHTFLKLKYRLTLIDTFILQNSIDEGKYIDRYYNNLLDYTPQEIKKRIFFIPTILGKFNQRALKNIKETSVEQIIYKHEFLKLPDYISAFFDIIRTPLDSKLQFRFRGTDITPLVFECYQKHKFRSFDSLLNYYFVKRLKLAGANVDLLIDWNENQPIDKALIRGFRDFYPHAYIKGYQGYIISTDYHLYLKPTEFEIKNGVIPDEICVVGSGLVERLKEFTSQIKVNVAPAFRFSHIHNNEYVDIKSEDILVLLPIGAIESIEILSLLIKAIPLMKKEVSTIDIKPHPVLDIGSIISSFGKQWPDLFNIVGGSIEDQLASHGIIIGSGSSTLLEGMAKGRLAIITGYQNEIDQNPVPGDIDPLMWKHVFTPEEMIEAINEHSKAILSNSELIKENSQKIIEDYFCPVNQQTVDEFFSIGN